MLELEILGFLHQEPMHGYELKQRIMQLTGHFRPVSDGALYPAIGRLEKQGFLTKQNAIGETGMLKRVMTITPAGVERLMAWLREPSDFDISDRNRYFTYLTFLHLLQTNEQRVVLERRLRFLETGKSFFSSKGHLVSFSDEEDPFRKGMLHIARETSRIEKQWLRDEIRRLTERNE